MKRIVFLLFIIVLLSVFLTSKKTTIIPDNAIRIRIIANSNDLYDQEVKAKVKNDVSKYLYNKLEGVDSYDLASNIIKNNINEVGNIIENYTYDYKINYGKNHFPEKEYKSVKYDEGDYESIVINLGKANGENFWCVLFPPICSIDEQNLDDVTYELYINKLLKLVK